MQELPFSGEEEIPLGVIDTSIKTIVNSQPMEGTPFIAPFVPVNLEIASIALEFAHLNKNDVLVDLGCGDGRILALAKERCKVIGIEYDPLLVELVQTKYPDIDVRHQDMFTVDLNELKVTVLVLYLLPLGLEKLKKMIGEWLGGDHRCITIGYSIPGWTPKRVLEADCKGSFMGGSLTDSQPIYYYS